MDPVEKLKNFGIESLHFLAVEKEEKSWCVAILASTEGKNVNLVVIVPSFRISEGIPVIETPARIIHQSLPDDLKSLRMNLAYMTNLGLDLKDIKGLNKSYLFENSGEVSYRLGFGEKFRTPLLCVRLEDIKNEERDLNSILDEKTSLFSSYLKKSSFPDLLKLPGQYTVFIPDNSSLEKLFRKEIPRRNIIDVIVLKVIVSGIGMSEDPGKEGDSRINMLGEPISFKKGVPVLGNKEVKVLSRKKCSNGLGMIVQISDFGKIPDKVDLKIAENTYLKLTEKYGSLVSLEDLKNMHEELLNFLLALVEKKKGEFLENLKMLENWIKHMNSSSKDVAEFIGISVGLLPFFKQSRDQ